MVLRNSVKLQWLVSLARVEGRLTKVISRRKSTFPSALKFFNGGRNVLCVSRSVSTVPSRLGFNDYDSEKNVSIPMPEFFNFASDKVDMWAVKEKNNERNTNVPAFWFVWEDGKELKWTFQDVSEHSKRTANVLQHMLGLKRGDHVMIILPKCPEWWLINIGAMRNGIVLSPGTVQLTAKDLHTRLSALKPACVFANHSVAEAFDQVMHLCPSVKSKVLVSNPKNERSRPGWLDFHELQNQASSEHQCVKTTSDETLAVFFTSGTSGPPKMAEQSHGSYGTGHIVSGRYWLDLTPQDIVMSLSNNGWVKTGLTSLYGPWMQGACVFNYEMPRFNPTTVLKALQRYPVTTLCAPPTGYRMLIQNNLNDYKFLNLQHCVSAGEPLNPEIIDKWRNATGLLIYEGYGLSETTLLCATFRCMKHKAGSMGKPVPGAKLAIIDKMGREVGPGVEGQVVVKLKSNSPVGLFKGYRNDPEKTASVFRNGYFWTGDNAYVDEDGYFWFVGRADDVILSSGYRIGPFEVESALLEHPAVYEVAVVSSPCSQRGEVVKAFIVLRNEYLNHDKAVLTKELQDHVKTVTAPYKYPRKIEFVRELPKTMNGKIGRVELRKKEWGRA